MVASVKRSMLAAGFFHQIIRVASRPDQTRSEPMMSTMNSMMSDRMAGMMPGAMNPMMNMPMMGGMPSMMMNGMMSPMMMNGMMMAPRCTIKMERMSGGMKMTCMCDDKTSAEMMKNLCMMMQGGM